MVLLGNQIVHFEIPVSDTEKMSRFYSELFGWKINKQAMPGMDYWMIETTGTGPNDLGGGMYVKQAIDERPRFYINVDDIDSHTERFKNAGGMIVVEKQEVPGMGWSVLGTDPEGNMVGLFQPSQPRPRAKPRSASKKKSSSSKGKKKSSKKSKR
jgi:uncharacterized protein